MTIVTAEGFAEDTVKEFILMTQMTHCSDTRISIDFPNDAIPDTLLEHFQNIHTIRIEFPTAADGRGFSLACRFRNLGFNGRLRAHGPLISDQFRYALSCGFDELEIDAAQAERQPIEHWRDFGAPGYREKLAS